MSKLIGIKHVKPKPKPNLTDVSISIDDRNESVEKKLAKLDEELAAIMKQLGEMREGPGKQVLKQKAMRILKYKRTYLNQSEQLAKQSFNVSQTDFTIKSLEDTKTTTEAMKTGCKEMKKKIKNINIDKILDTQDELADLMMDANEVQDALGQDVAGLDIDEDELEEELAALGETFGMNAPYMNSALQAPSVPTAAQSEGVPVLSAPAEGVSVDEFGLPQVS